MILDKQESRENAQFCFMISLKLHNLCYILNPNQGREHCNTSLESLKHDGMTLFYKKCQKMDMRQATVQRLRQILTLK